MSCGIGGSSTGNYYLELNTYHTRETRRGSWLYYYFNNNIFIQRKRILDFFYQRLCVYLRNNQTRQVLYMSQYLVWLV